jgi:hypothetical protein
VTDTRDAVRIFTTALGQAKRHVTIDHRVIALIREADGRGCDLEHLAKVVGRELWRYSTDDAQRLALYRLNRAAGHHDEGDAG